MNDATELMQNYIDKITELDRQLKAAERERDELKAMVNELRESYESAQCQWGDDYLWKKWQMDDVLNTAPQQSLENHDKEIVSKAKRLIVDKLDTLRLGEDGKASFQTPSEIYNSAITDCSEMIILFECGATL